MSRVNSVKDNKSEDLIAVINLLKAGISLKGRKIRIKYPYFNEKNGHKRCHSNWRTYEIVGLETGKFFSRTYPSTPTCSCVDIKLWKKGSRVLESYTVCFYRGPCHRQYNFTFWRYAYPVKLKFVEDKDEKGHS